MNADKIIKNFFFVLINKKRIFFVSEIIEEFLKLVSHKKGEISANLFSSRQIDDKTISEIEKEISENINGFRVYPNPANSVINLISNQNIDKVDIYDMYGKLVSTEKIGAKSYNIDIKDFKNNIYQFACLINNKWYYSKVIIIN